MPARKRPVICVAGYIVCPDTKSPLPQCLNCCKGLFAIQAAADQSSLPAATKGLLARVLRGSCTGDAAKDHKVSHSIAAQTVRTVHATGNLAGRI